MRKNRAVALRLPALAEGPMTRIRHQLLALILVTTSIVSWSLINQASAATAQDLDRDAQQALQTLSQSNPLAARLSHIAKAVLVFPNIVKAGLVFSGSYGEGELLTGSKVDGYYNSVTGSWGLQAGAQSYGYVVFLMTNKTVHYIHQSHGWEIADGRRGQRGDRKKSFHIYTEG